MNKPPGVIGQNMVFGLLAEMNASKIKVVVLYRCGGKEPKICLVAYFVIAMVVVK